MVRMVQFPRKKRVLRPRAIRFMVYPFESEIYFCSVAQEVGRKSVFFLRAYEMKLRRIFRGSGFFKGARVGGSLGAGAVVKVVGEDVDTGDDGAWVKEEPYGIGSGVGVTLTEH